MAVSEEACHWVVDFEVSKAHASPSLILCLLPVDQNIRCQLLLRCHACLSATTLPAMGAVD